MTQLEKEENALRLRREFDTRKPRANVVNLCTARPNWDACDFIDHGKQEFGGKGALCWKQNDKHFCVKCVEA